HCSSCSPQLPFLEQASPALHPPETSASYSSCRHEVGSQNGSFGSQPVLHSPPLRMSNSHGSPGWQITGVFWHASSAMSFWLIPLMAKNSTRLPRGQGSFSALRLPSSRGPPSMKPVSTQR